MPGLVIGIRHESRTIVRGLTRSFPALVKETMLATAAHWHEHIFPRHFGARNRSDYRFEKRNEVYLERIKKMQGEGIGKFRDEVLSGRSSRAMRFLFKITGSARQVKVRMTPETYFYRPFIGSFTDPRTGKQRVINRQPDKPDEVTRFNETDRDELEQVAKDKLAEKIAAHGPEVYLWQIT